MPPMPVPTASVALFVPCFIDQLFPEVGLATARVLEAVGCTVTVPPGQACCGQPMYNAGVQDASAGLVEHFTETFSEAEWIVMPSASCAGFIKNHGCHLAHGEKHDRVRGRTIELCDFLVRVCGLTRLPGRFAHTVTLHNGCHGVRELGYGPGERQLTRANPVEQALDMVEGVTLLPMPRVADCCGFGGTFSVVEPELSCEMGRARLDEAVTTGAEVLTSADMSCLMHLEGVAAKDKRNVRVLHVAQILAGGLDG
jgi:L-lactate dehydrogenase complex protein LldE